MIHFILGGARSGKSNFAEATALSLANKSNKHAVYIATATPFDDEMNARISKHQQDRADTFQLIESPLALSSTLNQAIAENVYLLDCLTLWLNNVIFSQQTLTNDEDKAAIEVHVEQQIELFVRTLTQKFSSKALDIIIVSNEVGLGVVPMGESTRLFVDYCGWLNQKVAEVAQKVTLITAGIPMAIKTETE